jgi:hypothetical protein
MAHGVRRRYEWPPSHLDLQASSLYDAAHAYVCHAKQHPERGLPRPTIGTVFEVVIDAKVYQVAGKSLQRWIVRQRAELNGPKGYLFKQRPMLE